MSYALSLFGLVRISHMPLFVSVEPAAVCQLRCPECPVGIRSRQTSPVSRQMLMSREVWERVLREVKEKAWVIQFYFQGEPLLNRDLPRMIEEAHQEGLYTIVSTNAQAITPELAEELVRAGLNRIIVSMDGLSEESYQAYRVGGSLEQCKNALRYLHEAKLKIKNYELKIELQCLRLRTNEHEWEHFRREYKRLGADRLVFKTAQLYDYRNGHPLMPTNPRYSRYLRGKDGLYHRRPLSKGCWRAWSGAVVTTEGDVLPCCYDKSHAHAYGNIKESSLAELFAGDRARAFRQSALHEQPNICQECWK
ncbi:MAG: radical SAM protein [Paludibacteraceae bacterium]|nr:radical SAM protein [Paludibacteraceae bacterium]